MITKEKINLYLSCIMMSLMFSGYILTTGLEVFPSEIAKTSVRLIVSLLSLSIILNSSKLNKYVISLIYLFTFLLIINQNILSINIIFILIIISSIMKIKEKDGAIAFLSSSILAVFIHIFLLATGVVSAETVYVGERERSALGFANSNQFAIVYLTLICSAFIYHIEKNSRKSLIIFLSCIAGSFIMMIISDSRTSMFSMFILIFLRLAWKIFSKYKITKELYIFGFSMLPILGCMATYFILSNKDPLFNIALSLRPMLFSEFYDLFDEKAFLIGWNIQNENVDNGYLMLLSMTGLPLFALIIIATCIKIYKTDPQKLPILAVVLIASIFESFLIRPEIPLSILFFSILFRNRNIERKENLTLPRPVQT